MTRLLAIILLTATLAEAQPTTTQVVLPSYVGTLAAGTMAGTIDQLRCVRYVMPFSITGATKLTWGVIGTGGTCGFGLYPDSGGGSQLLGGSASCTSAGAKVTTMSSQNLTAGTIYRLCWCSSSTATTMEAITDSATASMQLVNVLDTPSIGGVPGVGTAGSSCTSGAPPNSTGSLVTDTSFKLPIVVIE